MVQLAIRDDDMNFFTKVEDIDSVYRDFGDFPISFAVIPYVMDVSTVGNCPDTKGNKTPRPFGDNKEIVNWLKVKLAKGQADVLLHGETHQYQFEGGRRLAEMEWRDGQPDLRERIAANRAMLERLLDCRISCFVAPSNKICRYCIDAVADSGLDFSGIVDIKFRRRWTLRNLYNYFRRWSVRFTSKLPYPGILKYSDHKEINACTLQGYDYLVRMYDYCEKNSLPMVINVHYWHLRDNPAELETLRKFVMDYAIPKGAVPSTLSDILKN